MTEPDLQDTPPLDETPHLPVARLQRLPLREVWKHEALDFTQWLEHNIDILAEATNLNIATAEREKKTESSFSVDLVAETTDGTLIVIENQLGKSDHDHLGKLITYLTAMAPAKIAVWIVADPRPEHVAAITWLNESTNADFYLLKIEAVRIDNSAPAPLLTVIVGPSEEVKSIGQSKRQFNEQEHVRHQWWSLLVQHPNAIHHRHISPPKAYFLGVATGVRGLGYNFGVNKKNSRAELYIDLGPGMKHQNLRILDQLEAQKEPIEQTFCEELEWVRAEGKQACMIRYEIPGGYDAPTDEWPEIHDALVDSMNRLVESIRPYLNALHLQEPNQAPDQSPNTGNS